ncbi:MULTISPECIES: murein biosynthesis integral membrane protein MurJ [Cyanophyceae]|uniref:murein biosynthesis integral membrane protein MurJ n=1 Tax=Cyanophyceae TaxID=3028117 RepID=UPI00232B3308|nr:MULTISPECIES: murein biosynthesis integral membrane protein MurJ [Cyanophyceae]MDB9304438.1 murein biosynthesis integral membrane protein MurJ [Nodularia spumigena CS-591/12]MDB9317660.1 murein biosynthesis integral membrane protein MurJ [Nodularia spumigena CS-590/01A]MDB9322994.1 murein biosynthesis integral membrane protein MurJ [Nodularia spumigena CS-591/07A]MDB9327831.1 murein biosynthesis integral membrane protein MurJ [Nodularia spumigena CS-590/02]MDB9328911.1 murein biosynthesis i
MTKEDPKPARSFAGIAGIVAAATLISKVFGLVRQQAIAAAFGVGAAATAYSYAYIIPGFLLILLGGVNGPLHSAVVSVLAKRPREEGAPLVETVTTLVGGLLLLVTVAQIFFADTIIDIVGYGLESTTRAIAIQQIRIMAPMALFAGLIGIGFGTLNAANQYWLLSISPLLSSITVIAGIAILTLQLGKDIIKPEYAFIGGMVLAWGTLAGAILQWVVQLIVQWRLGLGTLRLRFDFKSPGVQEVIRIMTPATISSGMMPINVATDLYFASPIPGAAAGFNYANLLVQTPLGIISNIILLPLLPMFAKLADPEHWPDLKLRIRQGILLTAVTMLPLGALMIVLSVPIVQIVYERGAFKQEATQLVSSLLIAYGIGMFVYLGRDVLVRVFYALGDGQTPFRISIFNIFLNAGLDAILVKPFGATGIVLATVGVNCSSILMLLWLLDRKLNGLPWREWSLPILGLTGGSVVAGLASFGTLVSLQQLLGTQGLIIQLLQLCISGFVGISVFAIIVSFLKIPEVNTFVVRMRQRFLNR